MVVGKLLLTCILEFCLKHHHTQNIPFPKILAQKNSGDDLVAQCAASGEFGHEYLWEKYTHEKGPHFTWTFSVLT